MVRRHGFSRSLETTVAGGFLCLLFYPQSAVAREPIWADGAEGANDTNFDPKSGQLHPRRTLNTPRSAEGIRKRLAAGIGTASIEQDVPGTAVGQDESTTESQDHASTGTSKRREGWRDAIGDVCRAGEGLSDPDPHKDAHQGGDRGATGQKFVAGAEEGRTEAPFVTDNDRMDLHQQSYITTENNDSKEPRGLAARDGAADKHNSNELQPVPKHDPWEGYHIIAQADPVASWEILRGVRGERALVFNVI